jgi:hypothetical protein
MLKITRNDDGYAISDLRDEEVVAIMRALKVALLWNTDFFMFASDEALEKDGADYNGLTTEEDNNAAEAMTQVAATLSGNLYAEADKLDLRR